MEEELEKGIKTILIVDDEEAIRGVLIHNLEREGYKLIEAGDRSISSRNSIRTKTRLNIIRHHVAKIRWFICMQKN